MSARVVCYLIWGRSESTAHAARGDRSAEYRRRIADSGHVVAYLITKAGSRIDGRLRCRYQPKREVPISAKHLCAHLVVSYTERRRGHLDHNTRFLEARERKSERDEETVVPFVEVPVVSRWDLHRDPKRQFFGAPRETPLHNSGDDGWALPASACGCLRLDGFGRPQGGSDHQANGGTDRCGTRRRLWGSHKSASPSRRMRISEIDGGPQRTSSTSPSESVTIAAGSPSSRKASSAPSITASRCSVLSSERIR